MPFSVGAVAIELAPARHATMLEDYHLASSKIPHDERCTARLPLAIDAPPSRFCCRRSPLGARRTASREVTGRRFIDFLRRQRRDAIQHQALA